MLKNIRTNIDTGITDRALRFIAAMVLLVLIIITAGIAATRVLTESQALNHKTDNLLRIQP